MAAAAALSRKIGRYPPPRAAQGAAGPGRRPPATCRCIISQAPGGDYAALRLPVLDTPVSPSSQPRLTCPTRSTVEEALARGLRGGWITAPGSQEALADELHVLLRHRQPSIPQRGADGRRPTSSNGALHLDASGEHLPGPRNRGGPCHFWAYQPLFVNFRSCGYRARQRAGAGSGVPGGLRPAASRGETMTAGETPRSCSGLTKPSIRPTWTRSPRCSTRAHRGTGRGAPPSLATTKGARRSFAQFGRYGERREGPSRPHRSGLRGQGRTDYRREHFFDLYNWDGFWA
jgi:hypothetical protein